MQLTIAELKKMILFFDDEAILTVNRECMGHEDSKKVEDIMQITTMTGRKEVVFVWEN